MSIIAIFTFWKGLPIQFPTIYIPILLLIYQSLSTLIFTIYQIYIFRNNEEIDSNTTYPSFIRLIIGIFIIVCLTVSVGCILYGFIPWKIDNTKYALNQCQGNMLEKKEFLHNGCYLWGTPYIDDKNFIEKGPTSYYRWIILDLENIEVINVKSCSEDIEYSRYKFPIGKCYNSSSDFAYFQITKYHTQF